MANIYFSSDLHFCHNQPFLYEPRGFTNVEDMNEAIVDNFNSVITADDDLYLLGDIMLNDNEKGMYYFSQLPGRIHLILGNHCTEKRQELLSKAWNVVEICGYATILKYHKYRFYLSHYPTICSNFDENKPLRMQTICLCGHSHVKDKFIDMNKGIIYHVELDAHNCYPVSIDQIIEDIKGYYHR